MEVLLIKKDCKAKNRDFKPGEVYICGPETKKKFQALNGSAEFFTLEDALPRFTYTSDLRQLLLVRGGGLGDLIALSSVIAYLKENNVHTWMWTQRKFFHVFDWFECDVKLMALDEPLFRKYNMRCRLHLQRTMGMMQGERLIEQGSGRNWYEIFFEAIGANPDPQWFRPRLMKHRIYDLPANIKQKDSILICHRATANMRSARFEDIYHPLRSVTSRPIYVHQVNLTQADKNYIQNLRDPHLFIILPGTMQQFLCDIYDAGQVVTVDSVAVHFREGLDKMAIGLYNSFTTESRTKYYRYVKAFDLKSKCPDQPCFMHENFAGQVCKYGKGMESAPCIDERTNPGFRKQLKEILSEYI
jgi:hypothetical protein